MNFGRGMQLAVDGKIYLVRTRSLSVVNNPDGAAAACNFSKNQVPTPEMNTSDLPSFIQSYLRYPVITTGNCQFQNISFSIQNLVGVSSILWNFDDPASGVNNTSTSFTPTHIFSISKFYRNISSCNVIPLRINFFAGEKSYIQQFDH